MFYKHKHAEPLGFRTHSPPKTPPLNALTLGIRFQHMKWGGRGSTNNIAKQSLYIISSGAFQVSRAVLYVCYYHPHDCMVAYGRGQIHTC